MRIRPPSVHPIKGGKNYAVIPAFLWWNPKFLFPKAFAATMIAYHDAHPQLA
jgi:hypothetical protein